MACKTGEGVCRTIRREPAGVVAQTLTHLLLAGTMLAASPAAFEAFARGQAPAVAEDGAMSFSIPAQPLVTALDRFSRASGWQVGYSADLVRGKNSGAVSGAMTPRQALERILTGSGIGMRLGGPSTATLVGNAAAADGADAGVAADGSTVLSTITVSGKGSRLAASGTGFQGTPDWVYEAPAAVSVVSREAMRNTSVRNARELLANTAGVNVSSDNAQNQGINVNMRGLQDQGRVTTMIDGARQNFQRSGHGSTGYTYVDTALVRSVEVEKSGSSGVGGAGGLAGSVNFRTLVADDLIREGERIGAELDTTTGTNKYYFAGSAAAAIRPTDGFSLLAAVSRKKLGEYDVGTKGTIGSGWALQNLDKPIFTGSQSTSALLKAELQPTENSTLDLSWLHYQSQFSQGANEITMTGSKREDTQDVTNDTVSATFGWDPESDLIDLKARFSFNRTDDDEHRATRTTDIVEVDTGYSMRTVSASIENTSRFSLPVGELAVNYGVEVYRDDGKTTVDGAGVAANPNAALWYSGANPSGSRNVASAFTNATLEHEDWLTLSGGLRYDYYKVSGTSTVFGETVQVYHPPSNCVRYYSDGVRCRVWGTPEYWTTEYPTNRVDVDLSGSSILPTVMVAVKPIESMQIFGKYSQGFRPPTIMEAVTGGTHIGSFGPGNAPNPSLQAEQGTTYELGGNFSHDGLFTSSDSVRLKAVAFYREVEDYIALGTINLGSGGAATQYASYVNLDGKTRMRGIELEGNYDAGRFYVGGSYTFLDADYADTYTFNGASYTTGQYVIFTAPRMKVTVDGGLRLFDESLTIGARLSHVQVEKQSVGTMPSLLTSYSADDYTTIDLYGSYKFNDTATLRFAVNNVTDVAYLPALGGSVTPAPGRTATMSLNFKF